MASANTLCKKLLNVKNVVVESHDFYTEPSESTARSTAELLQMCPGRIPEADLPKILI